MCPVASARIGSRCLDRDPHGFSGSVNQDGTEILSGMQPFRQNPYRKTEQTIFKIRLRRTLLWQMEELAVCRHLQVHTAPVIHPDLDRVLGILSQLGIYARPARNRQTDRLFHAQSNQKFFHKICPAAVPLQAVIECAHMHILHKRHFHKIRVLQKPERRLHIIFRDVQKIFRRFQIT